MSSRAQLKLDDNKHLISESIIEEEDEISSVSTRETREGSIREGSLSPTILINQELDGVEVKQPAIYIVSPTATPAEKVTNQGNIGNSNKGLWSFQVGVQN